MTVLPRTDVHQHLWPPELLAALERRSEPPFARREAGAWRLHVPGEPACAVAAQEGAERAGRLAAQGVDRALLSLSTALRVETLAAREAQPLLDAWRALVLRGLPSALGAWGTLNLRDARPERRRRPARRGLRRTVPAGRRPRAPAARGTSRRPARSTAGARRAALRAPGARRRRGRRCGAVVAGAHELHGVAAGRVVGVGRHRARSPPAPARRLRRAGGARPAARRTRRGARRAGGPARPAALLRDLVLRPAGRRAHAPDVGAAQLVHGSDVPVLAGTTPQDDEALLRANPARLLG